MVAKGGHVHEQRHLSVRAVEEQQLLEQILQVARLGARVSQLAPEEKHPRLARGSVVPTGVGRHADTIRVLICCAGDGLKEAATEAQPRLLLREEGRRHSRGERTLV